MKVRNFNDNTGIKINKEKYRLIKSRGYNIQNLLDDAIDSILEFEDEAPADLLNKLTELETEIANTIQLRQLAIEDKKQSLKLIEKEFNDEMTRINKERKAAFKKYNEDLKEIEDLKQDNINNYNEKLAAFKIEHETILNLINDYNKDTRNPEEIKEAEFNKLVKLLTDCGGDDEAAEYLEAVNTYCNTYGIKDPSEVISQVNAAFFK